MATKARLWEGSAPCWHPREVTLAPWSLRFFPRAIALKVEDQGGGCLPAPPLGLAQLETEAMWCLPLPSLSVCGTLAGVYRREFLLLIQR